MVAESTDFLYVHHCAHVLGNRAMLSVIEAAIADLGDKRSTKRRSAAKRLRKSAAPESVEPLLSALEKEVTDKRTWETQYHMIMALGSCKASAAVPLLESILALPLEPMVHVAAGDALVRCSDDLDVAMVDAMRSGSLPRVEGAIRAVAMTQAVPSSEVVASVFKFASGPKHHQLRFAAASPGWPMHAKSRFLNVCVVEGDADTRRAATAALKGRYLKWSPL